VATTSPSPPEYRLLLDQGFPKPPTFDLRELDKTIKVEHLSSFAPSLTIAETPDWLIYVCAAEAGFDAVVTRDLSQTAELVEMWVLTRLKGFSVITWKRGMEDPVREWGQLLAYLPEVKKRLREGKPRVIRLPAPSLGKDNLYVPNETLAKWAETNGVSVKHARGRAVAEIREWLDFVGEEPDRYDGILGLGHAGGSPTSAP
jgi:hypothetical protein